MQQQLQSYYDRKNMLNIYLTVLVGGLSSLLAIMLEQTRTLGAPPSGAIVFFIVIVSASGIMLGIRFFYYNGGSKEIDVETLVKDIIMAVDRRPD